MLINQYSEELLQAFVTLWAVDSENFFNVKSLICRYTLLEGAMKNLYLFWDVYKLMCNSISNESTDQ